MWSKVKHQIEEGYEKLFANSIIKTPKDDYMYGAWHNYSKHNSESYHQNHRDDATVFVNLAAIQILARNGIDSGTMKRIGDLASGILR